MSTDGERSAAAVDPGAAALNASATFQSFRSALLQAMATPGESTDSTTIYVVHHGERFRMVLEFYAGSVFVHLKVHKWAPSVMRLMRERWHEIKALLRAMGFARIHAFGYAANATLPTFASRFGFREIRRTEEWILLECPNA